MNRAEFFHAIQTGDLKKVRQALESGMSVDVTNDQGSSALEVACFYEKQDIVDLLLNPPTVDVAHDQDNPICIVGYSSIFPGSGQSPDGFWQTLSGDHHQMSEVPAERWSMAEYYSEDKKAPGKMYTQRGGFIDRSPYGFDTEFFKIVPREAELMDPQQRLTLEATWFALEHAGIDPLQLKEQPVGVFCGIMTHDYADMLIQSGIEHSNFIGTGNGASVLSGRVSYFLGLQGPSMTIDTACSSSLVTSHLAMRSLQNGECDLALAGGVNAMLAPGVTINCCKANMLAEDGVCKSFSQDADGYGRGEGVGMLVLKRYNDALRDGNTIHGIIRGSAINQDGPSSGLTVPNKQAQVKVIRKALESAGLSVNDLDFIEAHGTGTLLGDLIEINALKEVFATRNPEIAPVFTNSAKAFVGHLEAAAGVAGIIRVLESFKHNKLTALPISGNMNPKIDLNNSQIAILQKAISWKDTDSKVRRAGVSSFGFSGTNAHMILEAPPATTSLRLQVAKISNLLTISAKDEKSLSQLIHDYIILLENLPEEMSYSWSDFSYSSQTGRAHFAYRCVIVADSFEDCLVKLKQWRKLEVKKGSIQILIPDSKCVSLEVLQELYQNDGAFAFNCQQIAMQQTQCDYILDLLSGTLEDSTVWQQESAKLLAMYAIYQRYQRMGIVHTAFVSQGNGHFLAAVLDDRLSFTDMLLLLKASLLEDRELLAFIKNTAVVYESSGYWGVLEQNLFDNLYNNTIDNQESSSSLTLSLNPVAREIGMESLALIYLAGFELNWRSFWQGSQRTFVQLPLYTFQRQLYRFKMVNTKTITSDLIPTSGYCPSWELVTEPLSVNTTPVLFILTSRQLQDQILLQNITQESVRCKIKILFTKVEDLKDSEQQLRVVDLRYMDLQTEHELADSSTNYFSHNLYQNQLLLQAWLNLDLGSEYIACFPQHAGVNLQIQLCHAGLQGQMRSIGIQNKQIIPLLINHDDINNLPILTALMCRQFSGVLTKYEEGQWYASRLKEIIIHKQSSRIEKYDNADAVVITGGMGALGFTMAKWYAQKGMRHIALIARRNPSAEQASEIQMLEQQYAVEIKVYNADVTDLAQMTKVITQISQNHTICHVYHLAGHATIKKFDQLTETDYQDSLAAKVIGAVNLRSALMSLAYWPQKVLLFSSVASLLPEPGQTTYAASNHMLDCLAILSQHSEYPMQVINWGLWGVAGAGSDANFVKRIRKGSGVLSEAASKLWLDQILSINYSQIAVLSIDWDVYHKHLTAAEKTFVQYLFQKVEIFDKKVNQREYLLTLTATAAHTVVMDLIKHVIVEVSGKSIDLLQPTTTFEEELALDSNLLAEIRDLLQERMGNQDLPYAATLLNDYASIVELADFLIKDLTAKQSVIADPELPTDYIRQLLQQNNVKPKIKSLKKVSLASEPPLILLHTIMGSVFFYKALVTHLKYDGNIYGIDDPYFSNLAQKFSSITEMANAYAHAIKEQFTENKVRVAGLSFAGAVAYEVAQQLIELGVDVDSVVMFDTAMPSFGALTLPQEQRQYVMGEIAEDLNQYYQAEINNNQSILNKYHPSFPKNNLRVILLKARSRDSVNLTLPSLNELCNGWLGVFCPEVYSVPGSHFSLFDRVYVDTTVQTMRYAYDKTDYVIDQKPATEERNREKLLLQAAKNGDSYLVIRLLKKHVNPMVKDENGTDAACFAALNDDLCSLAWIHYYAREKLILSSLFSWAIQGNALKTMSYLVENSSISEPEEEPDITLLMDINKQQARILYGDRSYQQREWMQILASHNASAQGPQPPSAMQILPVSRTNASFDLMSVQKIPLGANSHTDVVNKLKTGDPNKPKLFMFHAASGLALPYTLLDSLGVGDVYGVSNPYFGLQDQIGFTSIEEMALHYIDRIKKIQPLGPYHLSGWSLGGIVAQSMAQILADQGEKVAIVIMIDSVNHFGKPYSVEQEQAAIDQILANNTSILRYEGMKEAIQRCYLNTSELLRHHQAKPFLGRVVLLKADDHEATLEKDSHDLVQWRHNLLNDPFSGWGNLLNNLEIQSVAGGHNELFDREYVAGVHKLLKEILATVENGVNQDVSLTQRWGMNLIKALRRNDKRIVRLLLEKPDSDYSYHDFEGNLLDSIVETGSFELLEKLNTRGLIGLKTKTGSLASDLALEYGLLDLFSLLDDASYSFENGRNHFFTQSSPTQNFQSKVLGLL